MKSTKKLFAILTLLVFMMTLLPMAAFGGAVTAFTRTSAATTAAGAAYAFVADVTPATTLVAGDTISVSIPSNLTIADAAAGQALAAGTVNLTIKTNTSGTTAITAATTWAAASNGVQISLTGADTIVAGDVVTLTVNTTASNTAGAAANVSLLTSKDTTAATATVQVIAGGVNRFSSIMSADKTSVIADGSAAVTFTIYGYDQYNNTVLNPVFYIASDRGLTDTFVAVTGYTLGAGARAEVKSLTGTLSDGKVKVKVTSNVVGTSRIAVSVLDPGAATGVYDYLINTTNVTAASVNLVGEKTISFTAAAANSVTVAANAVASDGLAVVGGKDGLASATAWESNTINGNSVDNWEVSFKVVTAANAPVSGETVTFTASSSNVMLSVTSATTDSAGVAKVKATASKPGTYSVKATAGDKDLSQFVKYAANDLYDLSLITADNQNIAKDADFSVKFKFVDINGNQIKPTFAGSIIGTTVKGTPVNLTTGALGLTIEATTRPTDAAMDEKITDNAATADYDFTVTTEGYLQMKIKAKELNKEGDYTIRAYLASGKSATISFKVTKQGTPTSLTCVYDEPSISVGTAVGAPTVKRVDAAGVSKSLSAAEVTSDIVFTASDVRMITAAGIGATGTFTATADEKYAGDLVITVVDKSKKLTTTATIKIAKTANGITLTPPASAAVETDATVKLQVVDVEGTAIGMGTGVTGATVDFYVVSKPAGAIISTSSPSTILADIQDKGAANLTVRSNVAGEAKIQIVLTTTGVAKTFTKDVVVNFGGVAPGQEIGAKTVNMFIGATGFVQDGTAKVTDVAPFILDGRTFVAVRPIADAFGAEIGWNEATQTVTLTRTDMTLTIVIGSNTITKVAGGITTTSVADVPAFIKDGRTVLPFRAVGEAFGATVSYDAATQAVTFVQ